MTDTVTDLELDTYYPDFQANWRPGSVFYKLERGQHYAEPSSPSWQAFNRGDWDEALRLHDASREELETLKAGNQGVESYRIRVVETPVSPYVQWEMHYLRLRDDVGLNNIRVLDAALLAPFEHDGPIASDLNVINPHVAYKVHYDLHGAIHYVTRYTDRATVNAASIIITSLWGMGEPIQSYFTREIAPLDAPTIDEVLPEDYLTQHGRPIQPRS